MWQHEAITLREKGLALSLILQDPGKTLEDAEIQAAVDSVIQGLESEFGAALRE